MEALIYPAFYYKINVASRYKMSFQTEARMKLVFSWKTKMIIYYKMSFQREPGMK